jgi:transposase
MRGSDIRRDGLFSYVRPESRIPASHPLRLIRGVADEALKALDPQFAALYAGNGRPSIPPEQLLRALLVQAFYSIRSERQLMEQLDYNLLFRWFVGLSVDDPVWVPTVFSKNRDRLLEGDIAAAFMDAVLNLPRVKALLSDEHFSVDGTLIQAWASMKSFRRKDGNDEPPSPGRNGERNFHKEKRSNKTHASSTDPDARLARKSNGEGAKLAFTRHLLMENRNGLVVDAQLTHATGTAEPAAALAMLEALAGGGPQDGWRGQGLRHRSLRRRQPRRRCYPACGTEHQCPSRVEHRRPDDAPCWLPVEPGCSQTDRGGERLDQGGRRHGANQAPGGEAGRVVVCAQGGGLQLDPVAAVAADRMSLPRVCPRPHQRLPETPKTAENPPRDHRSEVNAAKIRFSTGFFSSLLKRQGEC